MTLSSSVCLYVTGYGLANFFVKSTTKLFNLILAVFPILSPLTMEDIWLPFLCNSYFAVASLEQALWLADLGIFDTYCWRNSPHLHHRAKFQHVWILCCLIWLSGYIHEDYPCRVSTAWLQIWQVVNPHHPHFFLSHIHTPPPPPCFAKKVGVRGGLQQVLTSFSTSLGGDSCGSC